MNCYFNSLWDIVIWLKSLQGFCHVSEIDVRKLIHNTDNTEFSVYLAVYEEESVDVSVKTRIRAPYNVVKMG